MHVRLWKGKWRSKRKIYVFWVHLHLTGWESDWYIQSSTRFFFFFFFWPSFSLDILLMKIPIRIKFHSKTAVVSGIWDDRKNFVSIFTTSEEYLKGLVTPECEHFHWYYDNILLSNYALLAASVMSLSR